MIAVDEDALICDLAETYGLFDYRRQDVALIATLAAGLRENSRIMTKLSGIRIPVDRYIAAYTADRLSTLVWFKTEDGINGRNRPMSILSLLLGTEEHKADNGGVMSFDSAEDFEEALKQFEVQT